MMETIKLNKKQLQSLIKEAISFDSSSDDEISYNLKEAFEKFKFVMNELSDIKYLLSTAREIAKKSNKKDQVEDARDVLSDYASIEPMLDSMYHKFAALSKIKNRKMNKRS